MLTKYEHITEENIREMVHQFYARVRQDETIGPIFHNVIGQSWDTHIDRLCAFWSTVLLGSRQYYGDPFRAHLMVQGIEADHFQHWLELFEETARALYTEALALTILSKAQRMANRMKTVLFEIPT